MQAILTTYAGPTNFRGGRIIAKCQAKRITVPWDHALGIEENHRIAAQKLADSLRWSGELVCGWLPNGGMCHVFKDRG